MLGVAAIAMLVTPAVAGAAITAPANDDIVKAQPLPAALPSQTPGTTAGATGEPGEKVFGNPATESVWFSWTPQVSGRTVVDLCTGGIAGPEVSTGIGVYTGGTTFATLTKVEDTTGPCKVRFAAVAGTNYKIQVDFLHAQGDFLLRLHAPEPPANDNFAAARTIGPGLPLALTASTIEATFETGEPTVLGGAAGSRSVWFSWTAPSSGHVQLVGCPFEIQPGSSANDAIGVYTGAALAALTKVVETENCRVEFDAVAGVDYKIAFSGKFAGEGTFALSLHEAPPPANDAFAAATAIGPALPLAIDGDDSFATIEPGESALVVGGLTGPTHSVWYRWTPAVSGRVHLNACGTDQRARVGVFTGTTIGTLKVATEPQNEAPFCAVELNAAAGTPYSIAIAGSSFDASTGPFDLEIHPVRRPANDNFSAATPIGPALPVALGATDVDATVEPLEPMTGFFFNPHATVWYRWQAPLSGPVDLSTCGSPTDVVASVYTGTLPTLTRVVPPDEEEDPGLCADPEQNGARARFTAVSGTTYLFQLSGTHNGLEGPFHLSLVDPNALPPAIVTPPPAAATPAPPTTANPPATPSSGGGHTRPRLKEAVRRCRRRFSGMGRKAGMRRRRCVAAARRHSQRRSGRATDLPAAGR
jgi:hypothetical protein